MPGRSADDVHIETYSGPRDNLRRLFELAEDSAAELDAYIVYWSFRLALWGRRSAWRAWSRRCRW
jgi:hypothetical protein